jgi:predicted dehydrogenase
MKFAVLGFGARGQNYTSYFMQMKDVQLAAVCEIRPDRLQKAAKLYNLAADKLFADDQAFAEAGRLADFCIISTLDHQHVGHALMMLDAGYDLMLEKPIATSLGDCAAICEKAQKLDRRVFVCHVLRYAPFFGRIKDELETGAYGAVSTISMTENVVYWHQAHSYVRGNWRNDKTAAPMIIAKCCHDLDIFSWLIGTPCKAVSSMGGLRFYTAANAPAGSADRCLDCAVKNDCAYDAERFYIDENLLSGNTDWPVSVVSEEVTPEKVREALRDGPYGRCVWRCDNNVVDHQIVNMEFEGGATAHLTMTAFSDVSSCGRDIHIHCEKGELFGNSDKNKLTCIVFGKPARIIDTASAETQRGHGGGDYFLCKDIAAAYTDGRAKNLTSIENSFQSHTIGFAAEKSRLAGGVLVPIK